MRSIVVDASAMVALAFNEPAGDDIARRLDEAEVHAPTLLAYEMANAAWKKARRYPDQAPAILRALMLALDPTTGIRWHRVVEPDVAVLSIATGLTAYDASYLWLAGMLGADLVTLDERLAAAIAS